jgi:hypothetical protein
MQCLNKKIGGLEPNTERDEEMKVEGGGKTFKKVSIRRVTTKLDWKAEGTRGVGEGWGVGCRNENEKVVVVGWGRRGDL